MFNKLLKKLQCSYLMSDIISFLGLLVENVDGVIGDSH